MAAERVTSEEEMLRVRQHLRERGKRVAFTNGCFDLLHVGHVRYLAEAAALADVLIVGLNDDRSVRRLKGPHRPVVPAAERAEVLAALEPVDYVVIFPDDTAERLVGLLQPDVYIKGGDYSLDPSVLPEAGVVEGYGGEVRLVRLHEGRSTTSIIERIRSVSA